MSPRRVLVVTDIDLSGWALRQALTAAGFVVLTAGDADAARAVFEVSDPFDVVVVSLSLGRPCVAALLDHAALLWPGVPAIVLAAEPEPDPIETRADDVVLLEKPYSVKDVVATALRFCGVPGAERTVASGRTLSAGSSAAPHDRDS
jgi:DNA-binding NtrC family response regulator